MTWLHLIQEGIMLLISIGASAWFYSRLYFWWRQKQSDREFRMVTVSGLVSVMCYLAWMSHMLSNMKE